MVLRGSSPYLNIQCILFIKWHASRGGNKICVEVYLEKGLTQEELAERCGTNKAYISKVENNVKDVRMSTLQKIIEVGLGGKLQVSIKL